MQRVLLGRGMGALGDSQTISECIEFFGVIVLRFFFPSRGEMGEGIRGMAVDWERDSSWGFGEW